MRSQDLKVKARAVVSKNTKDLQTSLGPFKLLHCSVIIPGCIKIQPVKGSGWGERGGKEAGGKKQEACFLAT